MNRREFVLQATAGASLVTKSLSNGLPAQHGQQTLPSPEPIPESHFPSRLELFIWRNWELANTDRLAQVLETTPHKVLGIGDSMGLPPKRDLTADQQRRVFVTVIRQNWHILHEDQLIELLGWSRTRYEYTLKEDDFLGIKLGRTKPHCERLRYQSPTARARGRAAEIKRLVRSHFGSSLNKPLEAPFHFVQELGSTRLSPLRDPEVRASEGEIDLSAAWTCIKPAESSGVPPTLVDEFRSYLRSAFGCSIKAAVETDAPNSKQVRFLVDPSFSEISGSFEVRCEPNRLKIAGRDATGLRQAVYYLQDRMEERNGPFAPEGTTRRITRVNPRYLYSYFALYGDPLIGDVDPFPEGYLEKLARVGVNGVWLQAVLRNLAPSKIFPEFGEGWKTRLHNLQRLVRRASRHGVKIYLYMNEPRAMPEEFYAHRPELKGTYDAAEPHVFAMCTSTPAVREWISDSLAHIFSQVSELGGIFTITMSENLTNCYSHGRAHVCPRCSKRQGWEVVSELLQAVRDGVRRASSDADIIAWDWGWGEEWVRNGADPETVIPKLPKDVRLLSVSEWDKEINRGGFPARVREYSISAVGPGPRATKHWSLARKSGLATLAKVQFNNTWEISAVPYIPVPHLIRQHCENLLSAGIDGLMLSWTVGGYPSPNLEVAKEYYYSPQAEADDVLRRVANRRYGAEAAPLVLDAWKSFSTAFVEFPFGVAMYNIPTQHGPANLLRLRPTGYKAGMMLFPHDDLKSWIGPYPREIVQNQFEKLAVLWQIGLESFRKALARVPQRKLKNAQRDLGIAETCYIHFRSVANQIRFYMLREQSEPASEARRSAIASQMAKIAEDEIQLAKRLFEIARQDSRIGYEASNHYYYRPLDLVEKVLNCEEVIRSLKLVS